jgi:hypothetical protein
MIPDAADVKEVNTQAEPKLNTPGPTTTATTMRCEGGVCVMSILLEMIFLKT